MFLQVPLPEEAVPRTPPLSFQISWSQASPLPFQLQLLQIDEFPDPWLLTPSDLLDSCWNRWSSRSPDLVDWK